MSTLDAKASLFLKGNNVNDKEQNPKDKQTLFLGFFNQNWIALATAFVADWLPSLFFYHNVVGFYGN